MAIVKDNIITQGLSGNIDKQIVFKTRGNTTFTARYPDMSKVVPSEKQLAEKSRFAKAVEYAKAIIADPIKKMEVAAHTPKGKLVYHQAIKDYLKNHP
ncbi:hypothetical protein A5893_12105 [Pedobacter psychrophilus]|uniref:Uncharacterized protein n=1 Tax=Pedobacter psychrophilus TaxID=1826909 RepID=A0A179DCL4_9SPHI|nr:hypothetical protein [Pedobacter psychrophilus]OAQ38785.1 hypothetical protein A5893_12105 [Pedobacter psychrophilus]